MRAQRRAHYTRLKRVAIQRASRWGGARPQLVGMLTNNQRLCSCWMCKRPRYDRTKENAWP